ncbi:MAG TPA: aminodeoxychorismate/anthranilate synthase component II [Gemmatimonadales bacterium]|nr:aminodeoxychorismate/anthranilate synthase component II [Gemmatimonadales bacterium]
MIFVLDNYDSFTYNLAQYLGELGAEPRVERNDALTAQDVLAAGPRGVVISPGPGVPERAGISVSLVRAAADAGLPLLGVCLGHQAIAVAFGGRVARATRLMHGKSSPVRHDGTGVLAGVPSPFEAMRYHSLVVEPAALPEDLVATAWSADRDDDPELMALRHRELPIHGVQFHPESIGTAVGKGILRNFLDGCRTP